VRSEARWRSLVALVALVALDGAGCSNVIVGTPHGPQSVPIRFQGSPPDATVTIDDQRVGSLSLVAARGIRVMPGRHRITVQAPGYLPFDRAVDAKDEVVPVAVTLVPVPD
jgi:hypothetical protein